MKDTPAKGNLLLDIARATAQAEAVRRAAAVVVKEWEDGIIMPKPGYGCGCLSIAILRDALSGYIPPDVAADISNATEQTHAGGTAHGSSGWRRCEWAEAEQHRRRLLTGSIGLEGTWSEWTNGKPERTLSQFEYEYRRHEHGA
jgi:hypothetical protein